MRERLMTLVYALGALALFASLFLHGARMEAAPAAPPSSIERGGNGLLAAQRWLESQGVRTLSLRERFTDLHRRRDLPPAGNLLIVTAPAMTSFWLSESRALERWLRDGNTLLLLAALADRPDWSIGRSADDEVSLLTGLETTMHAADGAQTADRGAPARQRTAPRGELLRALSAPLHGTLVPNAPHPYLDGVRTAIAFSDYPPVPWDVRPPPSGFILSLARQRETGRGVLWVRAAGSGTVIVSGFGSLFSNRALGLADNAQLLANIVARSVVPGGAVLFDDEHQGLAIAYDPARFYRDSRLYQTFAVLGAAWLVWVLGGTQLKLPRGRALAPREAELVRATGAFLSRALRPTAAARRMFEHFFEQLRLRVRCGAAQEGPPWEWLEQHPRLARADVSQLREWYASAYSDERVPLKRLHNLLRRAARQLML